MARGRNMASQVQGTIESCAKRKYGVHSAENFSYNQWLFDNPDILWTHWASERSNSVH